MLRTKVRLSFLPHKKRLRGIGRSQEQVKLTLRSQGGRALHIANPLTLPFYLLPFYLLREDGGAGRGKLTFRLQGKSIAHCKYLDFTFLPFTFLPFEEDGGPGRGKLTFRLQGESIAHCKYLDFTFLPFTFLPFEGGDGWRTWKRETHISVTGREHCILQIA